MDCFASLAMTERRKAGIAPGLSLFLDGQVKPGHDVYDVTLTPPASEASPATT